MILALKAIGLLSWLTYCLYVGFAYNIPREDLAKAAIRLSILLYITYNVIYFSLYVAGVVTLPPIIPMISAVLSASAWIVRATTPRTGYSVTKDAKGDPCVEFFTYSKPFWWLFSTSNWVGFVGLIILFVKG